VSEPEEIVWPEREELSLDLHVECRAALSEARQEGSVWVCAKCGFGSQEHGIVGHAAYQCIYEPTLIDTRNLQQQVTQQAETIEKLFRGFRALEPLTRSCVACAAGSGMIKDLVDGALGLQASTPTQEKP
jgi:hypothetical protein